jgi:hypothetical protein
LSIDRRAWVSGLENGRRVTRRSAKNVQLQEHDSGRSSQGAHLPFCRRDIQTVPAAVAQSRGPSANRPVGPGKCKRSRELPRHLPRQSKPDFIAKIGAVIEESDESLFWLEYLVATALLSPAVTQELQSESNEFVAIFTASQRTARANYELERKERRRVSP